MRSGATLVLRRVVGMSDMAGETESRMDPPPFMNRPCILLVDENTTMRQYLTRLLGDCYEIGAAGDASTALTLALKQAPDLIVADVRLRMNTEFKLLRDFHQNAWGKTPVILYSTAQDEDSGVGNSAEGETEDVIVPFSESRLLSLIR